MEHASSAQSQLLIFLFFVKLLSPKWTSELSHKVEWVEWYYSWGVWVGLQFTVTIRFSDHHLLRASFISSHLWWAIKRFMLRKHILDSVRNSYQIVYRCFDSPCNPKDIQSHSFLVLYRSHTHPQGREDLGRWGWEGFDVLRGQLLSAGRVEANSTSFWYDVKNHPTMAFHSPCG